jgi:proliferating cell nuclear antigen
MSENNNTMKVQKSGNANEVVQGIFQLKHLVLFTKCTSLCPSIEMYLKNDYPIILKYTVANLGEVKLVLAPIKNKDGR